MSSRIKTNNNSYFTFNAGKDFSFFSPIGQKAINQTMQYSFQSPQATSTFWEKIESDPSAREKYAEKVYRTVIDQSTGNPKESY